MSDSRSDELLRFMLSASTSTSVDGEEEYLSADREGRWPGDGGWCLSGMDSITGCAQSSAACWVTLGEDSP
eukprot:3895816-Prymnesium_polylepis.1